MPKELYWLTLTALMTAAALGAYILDRIMVRGTMGALANPSVNDTPQSAWAQRMMAAHTNTVENLVVFAPLVFDRAGAQHPHRLDGIRLRLLFLVPARLRAGLYRGHSGAADAVVCRRLDRADDAGAGDLRDDVN